MENPVKLEITPELSEKVNELLTKYNVNVPGNADYAVAMTITNAIRDTEASEVDEFVEKARGNISEGLNRVYGYKYAPEEFIDELLVFVKDELNFKKIEEDLIREIGEQLSTPEDQERFIDALYEAQQSLSEPEEVIEEFSKKAPGAIANTIKSYQEKFEKRLEKEKYNSDDITVKNSLKKHLYTSLVSALNKIARVFSKKHSKTNGYEIPMPESMRKQQELNPDFRGQMKEEIDKAEEKAAARREEISTGAQQEGRLSEKPPIPPKPAHLLGEAGKAQPSTSMTAVKSVVSQFEQPQGRGDERTRLSQEAKAEILRNQKEKASSPLAKKIEGTLPKAPKDEQKEEKKGFVDKLISKINPGKGKGHGM